MSEDELVAMIFLLLVAGHETTVNLIGNGTLALLENPDQRNRLRDNPALIKTAVEELLRYNGPLETAAERFSLCSHLPTATSSSSRTRTGSILNGNRIPT